VLDAPTASLDPGVDSLAFSFKAVPMLGLLGGAHAGVAEEQLRFHLVSIRGWGATDRLRPDRQAGRNAEITKTYAPLMFGYSRVSTQRNRP
jgi:hypothetical protein